MPMPTVRQVFDRVPLSGTLADSPAAALERARAARAAYAIRDARHRRGGQAAVAASVLKLSGRRR